ncbi:kinase-like domain-containing protein [Absidia repens]|uniref:mitogen-activated protein kinase kinase kinase n=1 Tax=Absidia repens TaxID=90262 RepID=A0A1X2IT13_9FUNG|nr:kinase-like domain-containing protein [Absidia repens]
MTFQTKTKQPSSKANHQPSPTTPSRQDYFYSKGSRSLNEVRGWSEQQIANWLCQLHLDRFTASFKEHNITGAVILDLDNESLKAMEITPVGERVRLCVAVKALRQECFQSNHTSGHVKQGLPDALYHDRTLDQSPALASPKLNTAPSFNKFSGKSFSDSKGMLDRSGSVSRFLGLADNKKPSGISGSSASSTQDSHLLQPPTLLSSPKTLQKRNSFEGGIMSMEKVKQTCVKVFGEDGQTRIVNVHNTSGARMVMNKVLHKFGIAETHADQYCIFVGSSINGEARTLSDTELNDICRSTNRPEKERLILRKRHMYPTHEEFKRKGTANARWQLQRFSTADASETSNDSSIKYSPIDSSLSPTTSNRRPNSISLVKLSPYQTLFGERPPSDVISSNLTSFFPNHEPDILETAEINAKRLSTTRCNSITSRYDRKAGSSRNSVLSELVQELGVDMDNLEEEEEEEEFDDDQDNTNSDNTGNDDAFKSTDIDDSLEPSRSYNALVAPSNSTIRRSASVDSIGDSISMTSSSVCSQTTATVGSGLSWMKGALIGRGTFGDVYLGLNPLSGELMAVKQVELPVENSASEGRKKSMVEALRREIALLQELQHENIVPYLGSRSDDTYFSIFLEYVPGGSVAGLLASYGAFQEPLIKSFVRQILRGLTYLHGKDIVHRDIKGANVLVDNKGGVKISDFGISKKVEGDLMQMTSTGSQRPSFQGSIFWMAPEVVKQTQYTHKADIWSVGCMVIEMFTGDHPFPEYSQMQAIFQIGSDLAPDIPAHISADGKDFLKCAFQLDHEKRASASDLLSHPFLVTVNDDS